MIQPKIFAPGPETDSNQALKWDKYTAGSCDNMNASASAIAAVDVAIDLVLLGLPMPAVWNLQMPLRMKLALSAAFALGFLDLAIGALRVAAALDVEWTGDLTYTGAALWFWTVVEPGIAITVACLIVIRPVLERLSPSRFFSSRTHGSDGFFMDSYIRVDHGATRSNGSSNSDRALTISDESGEGGKPYRVGQTMANAQQPFRVG